MLDSNVNADKNVFLALINQSGLDDKADYVEKLYAQFLNVVNNNNALYKIDVEDCEPSSIFTAKSHGSTFI